MRATMDRATFDKHLCTLGDTIMSSIADHFKAAHLDFDPKAFLGATAVDLDAVVRNALFYGAEVFPVEIPRK